LVKPLPPLEPGHAQVPQAPGLGIELDENVVEEFLVR
jgi:L-alanine-DL-glutamate epimerase-like enolase superfamily enzyme